MTKKTVGLTTLVALLFSLSIRLQGQEIVVITGKDGKRVYTNTEEVYQLVGAGYPMAKGSKVEVPSVNNPSSNKKIESLIHHISEEHGVDPELVKAVARVESNYNPRAVSYKGALGLMQLLPETAKRFGVQNVFDPKQNIEGGVKFLKFLNGVFPNNLPYILAAYNAGESAVLKHQGIPPYPETQVYVRKITGLYRKGTVLTANNESDGSIVAYRDEAGRIVYSNLETAYR